MFWCVKEGEEGRKGERTGRRKRRGRRRGRRRQRRQRSYGAWRLAANIMISGFDVRKIS
jgi:hypothetical protein